MAWQFPPPGAARWFIAQGQAAEFWYTFGGTYQGPQYVEAKLDSSSGAADPRDLIVQWHGIQNRAVFGGATDDYIVGISNPSTTDIWFHLDGGGVT
ncbi:hypothetical protein [Kitasatospora sp. NPDC090091]|uniref:hypothetical protein n=1 Tax=Kitasatospora sp. NPDC090091 TaxID=3364081 RepID=UPI0038169E2E